jgi:response regulator aspartate phosphatase C
MAEKEQKAQLVGRALYNLGLCYYNQDRIGEAIPYFERAVDTFESQRIVNSLPQAYFLIRFLFFFGHLQSVLKMFGRLFKAPFIH